MGIGYQISDRDIIDYDLWFIDRSVPGFRGPRSSLESGHYFAFTGAAQTLGRFVHDPFPTQIGRLSEKPFINLGVSGAGPEFYLGKSILLNLISASNVHIAQVLSGRSVSAGVFQCKSNNGVLEFRSGPREGEQMMAAQAYRVLHDEYGLDAYKEQVACAQQKWVELYLEFFEKTNTTTYVTWVSPRNIGEVGEQVDDGTVGEFPHFVTSQMLKQISQSCAGLIDCTLKEMSPQPLVSEMTGEMHEAWDRKGFPNRPDHLRAFNVYYATPEQHNHAAATIMKQLVRDGHMWA